MDTMTPSAKNRFTHALEINPGDIDGMGHVNNVVFVRWVQEVAAAHWEQVASDTLKKQCAWVVLRHEIDYKAPAYLGNTLIGTTWVGGHRGAAFDRYVSIQCEGKVLAEAKTTWCLLDGLNKRPRRIGPDILAILH